VSHTPHSRGWRRLFRRSVSPPAASSPPASPPAIDVPPPTASDPSQVYAAPPAESAHGAEVRPRSDRVERLLQEISELRLSAAAHLTIAAAAMDE